MIMKKSDMLVIDGESHTIEEWCAIRELSRSGLQHRLNKGMSLEEAVTAPLQYTRTPPPPKRQDRNCIDCRYSMLVMMLDRGIWYACDYMGQVGHRRPCEYGDKCTVKIKKGKRK